MLVLVWQHTAAIRSCFKHDGSLTPDGGFASLTLRMAGQSTAGCRSPKYADVAHTLACRANLTPKSQNWAQVHHSCPSLSRSNQLCLTIATPARRVCRKEVAEAWCRYSLPHPCLKDILRIFTPSGAASSRGLAHYTRLS